MSLAGAQLSFFSLYAEVILRGAVRSSEITCLSPLVQLPTSRRIELTEYLKNCLTAYFKLPARVLKVWESCQPFLITESLGPGGLERIAWKGGEVQLKVTSLDCKYNLLQRCGNANINHSCCFLSQRNVSAVQKSTNMLAPEPFTLCMLSSNMFTVCTLCM